MDYTLEDMPDGLFVTLKGQMTFTDSAHIKELIEKIQKGDMTKITLDFSQLEFIDSAGLGMLLLMRDFCQNRNIPIIIRSPRGQVERIFRISKFDQLFEFKAQ